MSLCSLEMSTRFRQAADVCYLHAITVQTMLARDGLPMISIAVSKSSISRGRIQENCAVDVPEGSTDLVALDSLVLLHVVPEGLTYALACLEMHLFNRNMLAISSLGVVGVMQGTRSENRLATRKHLQFHASWL